MIYLRVLEVETLAFTLDNLTSWVIKGELLENEDCWDTLGVDAVVDDIMPSHASLDLAVIV
jgi:hypothetical protein